MNSIDFSDESLRGYRAEMKKFEGLKSKTWLSGINNHTVGGFYEFTSLDCAQKYIDELLIPFTKQINGNLSVKLFNGEVVEEGSKGKDSPFYNNISFQ